MATSEEYLTFVCEQIARFGAVRYRKMFGDAMVYLDDKPILLVCDNTVFAKCLPETAALLSDAGTGTPYDGARPHYMLDIDNAALLDTLGLSAQQKLGTFRRDHIRRKGYAVFVKAIIAYL